MKNLLLLISSIVFSILFFENNLGLNLFLFSIVVTVTLYFLHPQKRTKTNLYKAIVYIITAIMVFVQHNTLSILTNIISFLWFIGSVSNAKSSFYVQTINGLYTTIAGAFVMQFNKLTDEIQTAKKEKINYVYWFKIIGIPAVVLFVFIVLYRNINPVFDTIISKIDLSFINIQWLLFTGFGYYVMYNISNPLTIEPLTETDVKTSNTLDKNQLKEVPKENLKSENQLGLVLMVLLNILIVFLLITDVIYLNQKAEFISASDLSIQVHNGINALISSIILAIALIVYFFRGNLNFYKHNKNLKIATSSWIFLNVVLVFLTCIKNYQYVYSYGFTYKRIGVFVYLFLAVSGLLFTFIKVNKARNTLFLFRKNIEVVFVVMVISSCVNWDAFITNHNIAHAKGDSLNVPYLLSLPNNSTALKQHQNSISLKDFTDEIDAKHQNYLSDLATKSWQEYIYENVKTN